MFNGVFVCFVPIIRAIISDFGCWCVQQHALEDCVNFVYQFCPPPPPPPPPPPLFFAATVFIELQYYWWFVMQLPISPFDLFGVIP